MINGNRKYFPSIKIHTKKQHQYENKYRPVKPSFPLSPKKEIIDNYYTIIL